MAQRDFGSPFDGMRPYDFADTYVDWVEDAPGLFFVPGPVMLGLMSVLLIFLAEQGRRRKESQGYVAGAWFAGLVVGVIVASYYVVLATQG